MCSGGYGVRSVLERGEKKLLQKYIVWAGGGDVAKNERGIAEATGSVVRVLTLDHEAFIMTGLGCHKLRSSSQQRERVTGGYGLSS